MIKNNAELQLTINRYLWIPQKKKQRIAVKKESKRINQ